MIGSPPVFLLPLGMGSYESWCVHWEGSLGTQGTFCFWICVWPLYGGGVRRLSQHLILWVLQTSPDVSPTLLLPSVVDSKVQRVSCNSLSSLFLPQIQRTSFHASSCSSPTW